MSVLAVDIGSQFVDLALQRGDSVNTLKHPVGANIPADAILAALDRATVEFAIRPDELREIRIGSTGAINALLARRGSRVALVTTRGFADTLYLGRQNRRDLYDPVARLATPSFLVRPQDIHEIGGRIDAHGQEALPLSVSDLETLLVALENEPVDAVAVCFLFAHINPEHELRSRDFIGGHQPDLPVILSHEIDPNPREFERTVAACLEAWLRPVETDTIVRLKAGLKARGFVGKLQFADGTGMLLTEARAGENSSALLTSGPAAAAQHAATLASATGEKAAISIDIGSTTTDIALIRAGATALTRQAEVAEVPVRQAMTDVHSVELGGLACPAPDGIGGIVFKRSVLMSGATLSDCLAWLGRIQIDKTAEITERIERLASVLGTDAGQAAHAAISAAEQRCATAVLSHAVKRNVDPVRTALIAMGGLGGVLCTGIAERLGIDRVLVPGAPAVAGALGMLTMSENISVRMRVGYDATALDAKRLSAQMRTLRSLLPASVMEASERLTIEMAATPLMHPFDVTIDNPTAADPQAFTSAFAGQYADQFGIRPPGVGHIFAMTLSRLPADRSQDLPAPELPARRHGLIAVAGGSLWVPEGWHVSACTSGFRLERSQS